MATEINEGSAITTIMGISKEIDSSLSNAERLLQLIKSLENVDVNMNILKTTKIGKKMSKLSQSKNSDISKTAANLVSKWRTQVAKSKGGPKTEASSQANKNSPKYADRSQEVVKPTPTPPAEEEKAVAKKRVREADVEYEQQKQEEQSDEDYDEFVSQNYTQDGIRQNIRKGMLHFHLLFANRFRDHEATCQDRR